LQIGAGALVSKGILTEEMAATATGAILSLAGVAWWMRSGAPSAAPRHPDQA
jgi:hypothetical protein